jgi:hypothetical protein
MATIQNNVLDKSDINASIVDQGVKKVLERLVDDINGVSTAGAGNGATVSVEEQSGVVHQTKITFTNLPLTLADATVGAGVKIYDFPAGRIGILGAVGSLSEKTTSALLSTLNASSVLNWGVGSTTQANGTLATTEQNIIPTTNVTASAVVNVAGAATNGALAASLQLDGTTTPVDAFLNVGVATADDIDADATVLLTGEVIITWVNYGDY